jgi:hypothetical protein
VPATIISLRACVLINLPVALIYLHAAIISLPALWPLPTIFFCLGHNWAKKAQLAKSAFGAKANRPMATWQMSQ